MKATEKSYRTERPVFSVLMIGGGRIALSHLPQIMASRNLALTAIVEPALGSRLILRLLTRLPVFKSLSDVDLSVFDAAYILTPPGLHFSQAKVCLESNLSVFIEKPFTLSEENSRLLAEIAHGKGLHLQVGYVYRYHPIFERLMDTITAGEYGAPRHARVEFFGFVDKGQDSSWRNRGAAAGCVVDFGSHALDLAVSCFGNLTLDFVRSVDKCAQSESVDAFEAMFKGKKNLSVEVACDWRRDGYRKAELRVTVSFENGMELEASSLNAMRKNGGAFLSVADLSTDVPFYIRGEEFARQQLAFECGVRASKENAGSYIDRNGFNDAVVDSLIEQIMEHA